MPITVEVVGDGVTGEAIAFRLTEAGVKVIGITDRIPNPDNDNYSYPPGYSTTQDGEDARHFTSCETTPLASAEKSGLIYRDVTEEGLLTVPFKDLSPKYHRWADRFQTRTQQDPALLRSTTRDVIRVNNIGIAGWESLMTRYPNLFQNSQVEGPVIEIFCDRNSLEAKIARERIFNPENLESRILSPEQAIHRRPALEKSSSRNDIVGGIDEGGFALRAKTLVRNMRRFSEENGTPHYFGETVSIERKNDQISAVVTDQGRRLEADVTVFASGPSVHEILTQAGLEDLVDVIPGVGVWFDLEDPGFEGPTKWDGMLPVTNMTRARGRLYVSSGIALGDPQTAFKARDYLSNKLETILKKILPESFGQALRSSIRKICFRPVTPTGESFVLSLIMADGRKLIITGGQNGGGATQAPAIAEAVEDIVLERERDSRVLPLLHSDHLVAA